MNHFVIAAASSAPPKIAGSNLKLILTTTGIISATPSLDLHISGYRITRFLLLHDIRYTKVRNSCRHGLARAQGLGPRRQPPQVQVRPLALRPERRPPRHPAHLRRRSVYPPRHPTNADAPVDSNLPRHQPTAPSRTPPSSPTATTSRLRAPWLRGSSSGS